MIKNRRFRIIAFPLVIFAATSLYAGGNFIDIDASEPEGMIVPTSEQDLEANAKITAPTATEEEQLFTEFVRFQQLIQDGSLDEADSVAKHLIELTISTKRPQSTEMAKALTNLAIVQHKTKQLDAAQSNFQSAIAIIEDVEDRLNARLVNPLKGLAAAQLDSGRPDLASTTFRRAVHVMHVNEGPHNLDQLDILEDLAEVHLRMGDLETARDVQDTIYALNVRVHERDTLELIPASMRRADWQHRAGLINEERATYRRIVHTIEKNLGRKDLALVEPLVRLGKSFFYVDTSGQTKFLESTLSTGEIYFKRALRIAAAAPDSNWNIVADTTIALGDYYMHDNNPRRARQVYRSAWELLSESKDNTEMLDKRRKELGETAVLKENALPQYIGGSESAVGSAEDDPILQGTVTVSYGISTRGHAVGLKLIESVPHEFTSMQESVKREIRRRIFRPTFVDAEPVATSDHIFVHTYYYRQSDLDAARKTAAAVENVET